MSSSAYIPVPVDTTPTDLAGEAFDYLQGKIPGWTPANGNLESWMIEALAQIAGELRELTALVPDAIFAYYGASILGLPPYPAVQATAYTTWTAVDQGGYIDPRGDGRRDYAAREYRRLRVLPRRRPRHPGRADHRRRSRVPRPRSRGLRLRTDRRRHRHRLARIHRLRDPRRADERRPGRRDERRLPLPALGAPHPPDPAPDPPAGLRRHRAARGRRGRPGGRGRPLQPRAADRQ